jgi:hypothetical protein
VGHLTAQSHRRPLAMYGDIPIIQKFSQNFAPTFVDTVDHFRIIRAPNDVNLKGHHWKKYERESVYQFVDIRENMFSHFPQFSETVPDRRAFRISAGSPRRPP